MNLRDSPFGLLLRCLSLSRVVSEYSPFAWNIHAAAASCVTYSFGSVFTRSPVFFFHRYVILTGPNFKAILILLNTILEKKSSIIFYYREIELKKTGVLPAQNARGGNMWESNPPGRFLAPLTGFEDRGAHQHPYTPMCSRIIAHPLQKSKQ